jgi:hypothetical protein
MTTAFSSVKKGKAMSFCQRLNDNKGANFHSVVFRGCWKDRRFVIEKILISEDHVTEAVSNSKDLTLTLPIVDDWDYYLREFARFGASISALYRKQKLFENVGGHIIHAYHHVALCGARGPWAGVPLTLAVTCEMCANVANSVPKYRARYHPLVGP